MDEKKKIIFFILNFSSVELNEIEIMVEYPFEKVDVEKINQNDIEDLPRKVKIKEGIFCKVPYSNQPKDNTFKFSLYHINRRKYNSYNYYAFSTRSTFLFSPKIEGFTDLSELDYIYQYIIFKHFLQKYNQWEEIRTRWFLR